MPGKSFTAVLRGNPQQEQQPQQLQTEPAETTTQLSTLKPQMSGQSAEAPSVTTSSLDDMIKVATTVQQIKTELNGALFEEEEIVAINNIVLNLMKENGH
jgi:hypothetical protein